MQGSIVYISVKKKFILTCVIVALFTTVCSMIEIAWWKSLSAALNPVWATIIIIGLAFFPGIMVSLNLTGIILDKPRRREIHDDELEDITILIAAYNEEQGIFRTLKSIADQEYSKHITVKVIDNNSTDGTKAEILRAQQALTNISVEYLFESTKGKFAALNHGLTLTKTRFVITIDADTYLYREALKRICYAMISENRNKQVAAIAGTVLVRNSRDNVLAAMQEWEYFLSIAGIKRAQGLFQSTLVAQGAFSIYDTAKLKNIGGWKDSIGEDIVLTWELLSEGNKTYYCDDAIAFTDVPTKLRVFCRQRARWARGMIEGFRHFSFKKCKNRYAKFYIFADLFLFFIDTSVTFFYIPGLIACLFWHNFLVVGPMTLLLFPITILIYLIMFLSEKRRVFNLFGLKVRKNFLGLICFTFLDSLILSPVCFWGYCQEFFGISRKWK